ncbi:MAG: hypothetical protein QM736_05280 [Vicinamibacterales bacterium]
MRHGVLTFWAPIVREREADLRQRLHVAKPSELGLALEGLHFAAAVIIDAPEAGLERHLLFEANFDGPRETLRRSPGGRTVDVRRRRLRLL